MNDVRITTDEEQFDVGHMWVQRANAIKNVNPVIGEKIAFYARVNKYQYRNHVVSKDGIMVETRYGLENPSDVEVLTPSHYRAGEPREPAVVSSKTAPVAALDTIEAIKVAKSLLVDLGAELVLSALPQLERLTEASAKLGGASRLREMVEVLR
ncbi:MAG: hypothetical protein K2X38_02070 [Gemmataceae bacterium]|nr:hypothetical protein [Gemmataceae bacterium]